MATFHQFVNNALGTVQNNPLTSGGTTLVTDSTLGTKLAALTFPFYLTLWGANSSPNTSASMEIVEVTANPSSNNFTIVRARQSTSASAHLQNDNVALLFTAGNFSEVLPQGTVSQGSVIYIGSDNLPHLLPPGSNGQVLQSQGASANPQWANVAGKFGGTGADGALSISSGVTTLAMGNVASYIKNYSSVSITGTASLAFSQPNTNGTLIMLKCSGNMTLTSSATAAIDASGMGSAAGAGSANATATNSSAARTSFPFNTVPGNVGATGAIAPITLGINVVKDVLIGCGSGGGGGGKNVSSSDGQGGGGGASMINSGSSGASLGGNIVGATSVAGGNGGGALYIEVNGTYTNTSATISCAGLAGTNAPAGGAGGGGGGGGGSIVLLYNTLGSDTGTYNVNGGASGTNSGGGNVGGAGATGYSSVSANVNFA